jgi:predicted  nucleic acid-binding Zn-ribbon protein
MTLQDIDQRLQKKDSALQELRQQMADMVVAVETKEKEAEDQRQRLSELEARHRTVEQQLKDEEEKIKDKRIRQNRIRNERELMAVRREIELMKEANGKLEEDGIQLLDQIAQENSRLTHTQAQVDELRGQLAQKTEALQGQIFALEAEAQRERQERAQAAQTIDADLCARYERIFARRGGLAVVEMRASTCQGCHMHIPPHMGNQIRSQFQQKTGMIFHCPHCGRILLWRAEADMAPNV